MPTYEYLCKTCSHRFETWQKMTDEPLTICPECGNHIRRVLFPAGVVFKGSGFYKTDYGSGKSGSATISDHNGSKTESASTDDRKSTSDSSSKSSESSSSANSTKASSSSTTSATAS